MLTRTSTPSGNPGRRSKKSENLHLGELLVLGRPSEQHLNVVARFDIEKIGELTAEEHAAWLALNASIALAAVVPTKSASRTGATRRTPRDRSRPCSHPRSFRSPGACSAGHTRPGSLFGCPGPRVGRRTEGVVKRTGRRGRHAYVRTHHERSVEGFAWSYDTLKDATLVPRATINPTMITAEVAAQERRRMRVISRPRRAGRSDGCEAVAGGRRRARRLCRAPTPRQANPIGTMTRCKRRDTARP